MGVMDLIWIGVGLCFLGAFIVFALQVMFWFSMVFGSGDNGKENNGRDDRIDAYETYIKMKRDEFFLNDGYKRDRP
jgi:hypothetical protein